MFLLLTVLGATASPTPAECESPPLRDVGGLTVFAQKSGALSVGLDSVATWCFEAGGEWTGGVTVEPNKKLKPPSSPVGDCARALNACETAKAAITPELKALLADALADLERPYVKKKYVPKRSGLADRPSDSVDCGGKSRPELFAEAQARMDLARLAAQVHSEYANYKTWLYAEGLKCAQAARSGQVDNTQRAMAVDTAPANPTPNPDALAVASPTSALRPTDGGASVAAAGSAPTAPPKSTTASSAANAAPGAAGSLDAGPGVISTTRPGISAPVSTSAAAANGGATGTAALTPTPPTSSTGPSPGLITSLPGASSERERALALPPAEKWSSLAQIRGKFELDRDFTLGFLASRELRDCRCPRPNPTGLARRYAQKDNVPQLEADEQRNTQCELCLEDAFTAWRSRVDRQCSLVEKLSDFEVGVLQRSDDGNGLPPRCFDVVLARRDGGVATPSPLPLAARTVDGGSPTALSAPVTSSVPGAPTVAPPNSAPASGAALAVGQPLAPPPAMQSVSSAVADTFSRAQDWAPIPLREDGRLYVRIFMSSACAADVLPGPIQARTGDLLVIPYNARQLSVRSPCGGLAEVYWGREIKPRVSEIFARNQPLHLQFQPQ